MRRRMAKNVHTTAKLGAVLDREGVLVQGTLRASAGSIGDGAAP
jgi:hypothetical protein